MQYLLIMRAIIKILVVIFNKIAAVRKDMGIGRNFVTEPKAKTYSELRKVLDTGDLILFSGKGVVSYIVRWFCGSKWSHIGMVVRVSDGDMILLFESTTLSKTKDLLSGKLRRGVQLVSLSERLASYDGEVGVVFLTAARTQEMLKSLNDFRAEMRDKPYEKHFLSLVKSAYDGCLGDNKEDLASVFCSELVAEAYQRMGILSNSIPSSEYTPADFDGNHKLPFINSASLSPVEIIFGKGGVS